MKTFVSISCIALSLVAAGCNSGTNAADNGVVAGPAPAPPPLPPPSRIDLTCTPEPVRNTSDVDVIPGGVWRGSIVDCANNVQNDDVFALVSEDGRFRILDLNEHALTGVLGTAGDVFDGFGTDFAATGLEYFSGPTTGLYIKGKLLERASFQGHWYTEWGFYGYFDFDYVQQSYERATTLADLAGAWPLYYGVAHEGIWTIETDGRFNGQDDAGCLQSGQFSIIDERFSIFAVKFDVTGCDLTGSYSGLALYEDLADWWERSITVSADNGTGTLRMGLAIPRP